MDFQIDLLEDSSPIPDVLTAPFSYIKDIPGNNQNMRYRFLMAFNEMFFKIDDKAVLEEIGDIITIFHNASLLIDDIEDSSALRRGKPCAHKIYGVPLTINSGNLMYFVALQKAIELSKLHLEDLANLLCKTNKILVDEMLNLHHGQGLDIYWRDNLEIIKDDLPSVDDYLRMVKNKTGGLFRLSVKLLALFSPVPNLDIPQLMPFANMLGIIYQIRDDYLNIVDERYSEMKGLSGEDLVEGKLSLPVLHNLRTFKGDSPLHHVLFDLQTSSEREASPELIENAIRYMRETGSLGYTKEVLDHFTDKAKEFLISTGHGNESLLMAIVTHLGDVDHTRGT